VRLVGAAGAWTPFTPLHERVRESWFATTRPPPHLGLGPPAPRQALPRSSSALVPVPTRHQPILAELRDALFEVTLSALFYHTIEARYGRRRGRGAIRGVGRGPLGLPLAERLAHIDPYVAGSLDRFANRHLNFLALRLADEAA